MLSANSARQQFSEALQEYKNNSSAGNEAIETQHGDTMWEFAEVIIGAIVGSFLGAALYHQVQQLMPIVIGFVKRLCKRLTKGWVMSEPKEGQKPLE